MQLLLSFLISVELIPSTYSSPAQDLTFLYILYGFHLQITFWYSSLQCIPKLWLFDFSMLGTSTIIYIVLPQTSCFVFISFNSDLSWLFYILKDLNYLLGQFCIINLELISIIFLHSGLMFISFQLR